MQKFPQNKYEIKSKYPRVNFLKLDLYKKFVKARKPIIFFFPKWKMQNLPKYNAKNN